MSNNLFISYDLNAPNQNYEKVADAIKSLGSWAKVHKSVWYVDSSSSAESAAQVIWKAMDSNDTLIVIDSTNNNAFWHNLSDEVSEHIKKHWK